MECVAGNVTFDVEKKILVCRDTQSGRSTLPFDYESAADVDVRERADCALIGLDMAVASNSDPLASSGQNQTRGERYNRNLLHVKYASVVMMR